MRLAEREGLLSLTLDKVADETGLSKGGLTYHFGSKNDLLLGLVEYFGRHIELEVLRYAAEDPEPQGRWIRAMMRVVFPDKAAKWLGETEKSGQRPAQGAVNKVLMAILAAALHNRDLLKPMTTVAERMKTRILADQDTDAGVHQALIWLALDGLFLWEFVGLIEPSSELYERLVNTLWQRTRGEHVGSLKPEEELES